MSVREYIGARYVPLFADPIDWDSTKTYEPLTIVYYQGNSYTSRQAVPAGISIENEAFWALTGNYNAQIEQYRDEVRTFDGRIDALEDALPISEFDDTNTIDARFVALENVLPISEFDDTNTIDARFDVIEANGWVTTDRIANNAITSGKIADGAITSEKIADEAITKNKESKRNLIVFGDSWGTSDNNTWPANLANALNLTLVDYAEGGVGWAYGSNNMQTQVQNASSDSEAEIVIAIGGINDVRNSVSYDDYKAAIKNCANAIRTKYPKARCYIIPLNIPAKEYGTYTTNAINNYYYNVFTDVALRNSPISLVDIGAWFQPLAPYGVWTSDNLHISTLGNQMFVNYMYSTINGACVKSPKVVYPITAASGVNCYGRGLIIDEGIVTLDITGITIPSTQAGASVTIGNFANFNTNTTPYYARKSVSDIYIPCVSMTDGAYVGKLVLTPAGALTFTAGIGVSGNIAPARSQWFVVG